MGTNKRSGKGKDLFAEHITPISLSPGDRIGNYRVLRKIGEGGMGEVYEATNDQIGIRVAVKIMPKEHFRIASMINRFRKEAMILKEMNHPGIVKIFDFGFYSNEYSSIPYIVMQYIDGESLRDKIDRAKFGIPPRIALELTRQIANSLQYAHGRKIIHRDIKPENIMLYREAEHERVMILDFGIAKIMASVTNRTDPSATQIGMFVGTTKYSAPEQISNPAQVNEKADVYALGTMLAEMIGLEDNTIIRAEANIRLNELEVMIKSMTHTNHEMRPSMQEVENTIVTLSETTTTELQILRPSQNQPRILPPGDLGFITTSNVLIEGDIFRELIECTLPTASLDPTKKHLAGVFFESDGQVARMVSTDGHRLSFRECFLPGSPQLNGIFITRESLSEILDFIQKKRSLAEIYCHDGRIFVKIENRMMWQKFHSSRFVPYEQVIPSKSAIKLIVSRHMFSAACHKLVTMLSEKSPFGLILTISGKNIQLSPDHPVRRENGPFEYLSIISPLDKDKFLRIGVNSKYLTDYLDREKSFYVQLEFNGELDPMVISPLGHRNLRGDIYLHAIMPMRI